MPQLHPLFWHLLSPELMLAGFGVLFVILSALPGGRPLKRGIGGLCLLGLVLVLILTLQSSFIIGEARVDLLNSLPESGGWASLTVDPFSQAFKVIFLLGAILTVLMSFKHLEAEDAETGEFYTLITFAVLGMMVMASGRDLLTLWVGLETMALSVYVLAAYLRRREGSVEGALKYFLLGALSSGFYLYGVSFIYGATGSVHLDAIRLALALSPPSLATLGLPLTLGLILLAVALLFKAALVPFHWWTPDAYEGAPTAITAFMSVAPKAAAFAMALRIFVDGLLPLGVFWSDLLAAVSLITMVWGNVAAMVQTNVKRMLAYSSIAHAGYALIGLAAAGTSVMGKVDPGPGVRATLFYLIAYTFMNVGAFCLILYLQRRGFQGDRLEDFSGLIHKSPAMALFMILFLLSLAGIPPTAGFVGKLQLFLAAVAVKRYVLAAAGILTSVVSLYYYFRIVLQMCLKDETPPVRGTLGYTLGAAVYASLAATLALGLYAQPVLVWLGRIGFRH
jgi:NADH-quinone oxidoreductase subunit N